MVCLGNFFEIRSEEKKSAPITVDEEYKQFPYFYKNGVIELPSNFFWVGWSNRGAQELCASLHRALATPESIRTSLSGQLSAMHSLSTK